MKVLIAPVAVFEIAEIEAFVSLDDSEAGRRLADDLLERCFSIGEAPEIGTVVGRRRGQDIRRLVHGRYLIVYSISEKVVHVHRVRHGARNPRLLLKNIDLP